MELGIHVCVVYLSLFVFYAEKNDAGIKFAYVYAWMYAYVGLYGIFGQ